LCFLYNKHILKGAFSWLVVVADNDVTQSVLNYNRNIIEYLHIEQQQQKGFLDGIISFFFK
jgi:hypothetical protein